VVVRALTRGRACRSGGARRDASSARRLAR
jgi:hypothetical protein